MAKEEKISRIVAQRLQSRLKETKKQYLVTVEKGLYHPPRVDVETGKDIWPGDALGTRPWKQDICIGTHVKVDKENSEQIDFIPLVTIEAKIKSDTDAFLAANAKIRRLRHTYPYLHGVLLKYNRQEEEEYGPSAKAFTLLRQFDAYITLRYSNKSGNLRINNQDFNRLYEITLRMLEGAETIGLIFKEDYYLAGWQRSFESIDYHYE